MEFYLLIDSGLVLINVYNIERVPPMMSILKIKSANRLRTNKENIPIFSTFFFFFFLFFFYFRTFSLTIIVRQLQIET